MTLDYYSILNASRDFSAADLRAAYRKRVSELHPDVNPAPDATAQFAELAAAYAVLRDPEKRAEFDRLTEAQTSVSDKSSVDSLFDKLADAADALLGSDPQKPAVTAQEQSLQHLANVRQAIAEFYELPVASDTCRAFLLAAIYEEPARSASMEAVTHLYLNHEDARAVAVAAAPDNADSDTLVAVTAAIVSGAAVEFVERGLLTTDPPLGVVDHSTQTIKEVATDRMADTFVSCRFEPLPRTAL